ncbi:MAG: divalent-cation tolerance protein CutA [Hadesarchaea archaeon]|nr:divalent-cation tolerance protein CutA [Hadesarchaea archaeon]
MFYVVFTTARDREEAENIARRVVEERLAACVNVVPNVASTYLWKGRVERGEEVLLLMKTSEKKLENLFKRVAELHSYEVPELLALPIGRGSASYMRWMEESLR